MRITGRELRRVINEEVRRSMRLNEEEAVSGSEEYGISTREMTAAAITANEPTAGAITNYVETCKAVSGGLNDFINNETIGSNLGAAAGHFSDITKKGSKSVYSKAINDALLASIRLDPYAQLAAVIGTLQSGKWTSRPAAYATLAGTTTSDNIANINAINLVFKTTKNTNFLANIKNVIATDIIALVATAKEEAATSSGKVATGRAAEKSAAAATATSTADDAAKWEKYEDQGTKFVEVHDKWDEFAASRQNKAEGSKFTNSFADFVRYYKTTAEQTGKARISPAEFIVLIDAHIEKGFETSDAE